MRTGKETRYDVDGLVGSEQYGVVRNPVVQAKGFVALANVGAMQGPCAAGSVHFRHPSTGATYSNTLDGEFIAAGTALAPTYVLMPVEADVAYPGSNGNAVQGVTLSMTTPFPGVSVCALGTYGSSDNLVGTDAELNFALLARCKQKLQAISPDGADGALKYVAETPSIVALFGTVSAPITRARRWLDYATGIVWLWIANADGPALAGDVAVVQEAEQALAVPTGMTWWSPPRRIAPSKLLRDLHHGSGSGPRCARSERGGQLLRVAPDRRHEPGAGRSGAAERHPVSDSGRDPRPSLASTSSRQAATSSSVPRPQSRRSRHRARST